MATATVVKTKPKTVVQKAKEKPERKTILVEMVKSVPQVTFTGGLWTVVEIKLVNQAIIRAYKERMRELYRKGYKK